MANKIENTAHATPHDRANSQHCISSIPCSYIDITLRHLTRLLCILWLELVLCDWLTSTASPYPYPSAILITLAVITACFLGGGKIPIFGLPGRLAFMVTMGLAALICTALQSPLNFGLAIIAGLALWLTSLIRVLHFRVAIVILLMAFATYMACSFVRSAISGVNITNYWLGSGLGTGTRSSILSGNASQVMVELGFPLLVVFETLLVFTLIRQLFHILAIVDKTVSNQAERAVVFCAGGVIWSFLILGVTTPFCLSLTTFFGTWAIALSIVIIRIFHGESTAVINTSRIVKNNRTHVDHRGFAGTGVIVLLISLIAGHLYFREKVCKFFGSNAPLGYPSYTTLNNISAPIQEATIAMEDGHFYQHNGFDWEAMHTALRVDVRSFNIEQGSATISQQLARRLFLMSDRTIVRTMEETAYTIEMEHDLPKRRILELYLNSIDFGYGCHGIAAAARYYFHTTPAKLSVAQSAILVGLVPRPPQFETSDKGETRVPYEDLNRFRTGEEIGLDRMEYFFPGHYSQEQINAARATRLDRLIYPYKNAWDRGATEYIPATWHGIDFYYYEDPRYPTAIENVALCLKNRMAGFLDEARSRYQITGIYHMGVYNDWADYGSNSQMSAHAYGQAIDICGFRSSNGTITRVEDHKDPRVATILRALDDLLRKYFDVVVDWRLDPVRHQSYFHCEVIGTRSLEERESTELEAKRSTLELGNYTSSCKPHVEHVSFRSRYMGNRLWGFNIFLPPSYLSSARYRYPTIYFCHGYGDDENTWVRRGLPLRLQDAMISGRSPDMIMVFMNGGKASGFNENGPSEMVESYVIKELVPYIDSHFRTIADRRGRSVEGFSMGGYGALKLAYNYPGVFSDVVSYSAATWFGDIPGNFLEDIARNNGSTLRKELKIRLVVGQEGDQTLGAVRRHHNLLDTLGIPSDYEEVPNVGHSLIDLYDADNGNVGIRGLDFHANNFFGGTCLPTDVQARALASGSIGLTWTSTANAIDYEVMRSSTFNHNYSVIAHMKSVSYIDSHPLRYNEYSYYKICAIYSDYVKRYSAVVRTALIPE